MTTEPPWQIRKMAPSDLPAVLEVENACYANPWSEAQFRQELDRDFASVELLWVGRELGGFLCWWYLQGELEILNVATAPRFRRQGVARRLVEHVLKLAVARGMSRAYLEVRAGNRAAISLYGAFGFKQSYLRRGYYPDGEDALVMERVQG